MRHSSQRYSSNRCNHLVCRSTLIFLIPFISDSFCPCSPSSQLYSISIACRWPHPVLSTTATTSSHTSLSMLAIVTVSPCAKYSLRNPNPRMSDFISVRNLLAMFALFSVVAGFAVFVTSVMLMVALRNVSTLMQVKSHSNV